MRAHPRTQPRARPRCQQQRHGPGAVGAAAAGTACRARLAAAGSRRLVRYCCGRHSFTTDK